MNDEHKTREELLQELHQLRQLNKELTSLRAEHTAVNQALNESERRYRYFTNLTSDYVYSCLRTKDSLYQIDWMAGAFQKITGYSVEELMQAGCWIHYVHPDDKPKVQEYLVNLKPGQNSICEFRLICKDSGICWIREYSLCAIDEDRPEYYRLYGASQDITEQKWTAMQLEIKEEQIRRVQKLEAVGTLAGGIAHDFNNLLQGVFGYISMAKLNIDQRQKSLDMLEQAEKALHMSVNLTSQLLTFSKGGKPLIKRINPQPVIENAVKFALSGSKIDCKFECNEALWSVDADEGQIGQVVQNIALNAEQAMPMGGTLTITADNLRVAQKRISPVLSDGNYIVIIFKDNGIGIPEEYLPRIFDPYFTTKDKGSGLGLAISYSIIKNHGGIIEVCSEMGKGSTFSVWLPAIEGSEDKVEPLPVLESAVRKGRILLMDDDELVRDITGNMIRSLGHEVEFAEDGEEAIAKYQESVLQGSRFDVVILDLTIRGGMGGERAIEYLLKTDPAIKAVLSSGYADSSAVSDFEALGFRGCLSKPYTINELNDALNNLLNAVTS
jgi:PAS domain S-box-containing protein